ncbi:MAG: dehydrogenase [Verrucomicrobia bacterium]|nr:dehydrogenase [Verrucomicrobiota bacterium]
MKSAVISTSAPTSPAPATCLALYEQMVLIRHFELAAQKQYKAGRMPGFIHLYVGEEAVAVGVCAHLRRDDWITSTHRGHGHAIAKGVDPKIVLAELYGKATGCCGGRGGSMHLYDPSVGLFGTNGFVGGGIPATVGVGLGAKVRKTDQVSVAFFGDGATNHGAFHESVNLATAQNAPVIFVCENNLYATATPLALATKNPEIASRAAAYGLPGIAVDGNDVLAVWEVTRQAVERARSGGGPTLIEAKTYRTVGHHEGDPLVGTYRQQDELDAWKNRCPILRFGKWLVAEGLATNEQLREIDDRVTKRIEAAVEFAESSPLPDAATANDHVWANPVNPPLPYATAAQPAPKTVEQSWLEAVRDGLAEEMRRDPNIIYLGEGIGERGGSFAHTKGLWKEFGAQRVIDTPICELGFTGAAIGASATGNRAVADLMFIDFLFEAASQVIQQAAKLRYMSNGQISVPMIVRASMGAIKNAGPHHSGTYYPIWAHIPGLIVVVPSNPADAKGLIKTALRCSDPVIFLEHKLLFGSKGQVPVGEHFVPFGQAEIVRSGKDLTIVTCGVLVHRSLEAATSLEKEGVLCEIIDLRTIVPLDVETILESVARTKRLLIVDEAYSMCGVGAEISAAVMEHAFEKLAAPVGRLHPDPVAQPFSPPLENEIVVSVDKIVAAAQAVVEGRPLLPRRLSGYDARLQRRTFAATELSATKSRPKPATVTPAEKPTASGVPIVMPNLDLTVTEATVVRWLKKIGDPVRLGEPIVEVETEKAVVPIESPTDGVLAAIFAGENAVVALTESLGTIQPA